MVEGKYWATTSYNQEVRLYEAGGQVLYRSWHIENDWVKLIGNSFDGRLFAGGTLSAQIYVWDVGIDLLLTERKIPPSELEQLRSQGIVPEAKNIIVVKSPVAFRSAYEPIATDIFKVDILGICATNLNRFIYRKLRCPIFPLNKFQES